MPPHSAYVPLLHDNDADGELEEATEAEVEKASARSLIQDVQGHSPRLHVVYLACALSLVFSIVNLCLLVTPRPSPFPLKDIEFASSYVGLERTHRDPTAPPPPSITSFPTAIGVVNQSEPHAVYLDAPRWESTFGVVYLPERRVVTSSMESTVIQYWAGDFGMKRCSLKLLLPSESELKGQSVVPSGKVANVEIWRVDEGRKLDVHGLSWTHRPRRTSLLASWAVRPNATLETKGFHCSSGSYQTFELACGGEPCTVDFVQSPNNLGLGVWLVQNSSL
ncbi:hypothetical protein C8Q76DRAFT_793536 [Earliella scabrosa]|nr:hypothetical protein C8Q76DRAFT_793536 [Earliella scabrosa]